MAGGYKLNLSGLELAVSRNKRFQRSALASANRKLKSAKEAMIQSVDGHPVSIEISQGVDGQNISGTLGGSSNLFSFIGFEAGDSPVSDLKAVLEKTSMNTVPRLKTFKRTARASYNVNTPSGREISSATPLPWESGISWVNGIERGISGFGNFLAGHFDSSRSGGGIQSSKGVRPAKFSPVPYLSVIFNAFRRGLRK